MPVYEYECEDCGIFEIKQSIKEDSLINCPKCHKNGLKRILSICSSHFKGDGFYSTDYKNNGKKRNKETKK